VTVDGQSSAGSTTVACQSNLWGNSAWYPQLSPIGRALGDDPTRRFHHLLGASTISSA